MATKHVPINDYSLYFRPTPASSWGFPGGYQAPQAQGYLALQAQGSAIFYLVIVDDAVATLPQPKTSIAGNFWIGVATIRRQNLTGMLDLLRNEKPIYITLFDDNPGANTISTNNEPIGEGPDTSP